MLKSFCEPASEGKIYLRSGNYVLKFETIFYKIELDPYFAFKFISTAFYPALNTYTERFSFVDLSKDLSFLVANNF